MPDPTKADLLREMRRVRNSQFVRLARDLRPVAERLERAYAGALPGIRRQIGGWADGLSPSYPDIQTDRDMAATESLIRMIEQDLDTLRGVIQGGVGDLEGSAIEQGVRGGVRALRAGGVRVQFGRPMLEAIQAGINYVDSPAFQLRMLEYAGFHAQQARDIILTGIATGNNPNLTARLLREYFVSGRPLVDAQNWARTTQMYSYRQGTRSIYERTGIREWVWSSALDDRTCVACIAMHGTVHPVSEVLNDHHRGRCAMVPLTPRWSDLGIYDGQELQIETGPEWLARQDDDRLVRIMGPELFGMYQDGLFAFTPNVMVGTYQNEIFGEMRRRRTNRQILDMAQQVMF